MAGPWVHLLHLPVISLINFIKVLLLPTMFNKIGEKTFYVFGIANAISIPIVWVGQV